MGLLHSPKVTTDGLVFMYDTGNSKSYPGEPTTNLATDSPSQGGWSGGREVLDSSQKKFKFIVNNFNATDGAGQGWRSFTWDLNSYSGQSVTISATVEVPSESPGTFAWIMAGQTNTTINNNSGAGQYLGYSSASEKVSKTTTTTERITWSGTIGSTGTANQPSGHVGFTLWYNGGTIGVDSYVIVSNVQIEIKSHATPFVNGTRSATEGLIDRTGNSTISLSNVSFDSNAQPTFDGTDDYIDLGDLGIGSGYFTVESVIYPKASSPYHVFFRKGDSSTSNDNMDWSVGYDYNQFHFRTQNASVAINEYAGASFVNNYGHVALTYDGSTIRMYLNGSEVSNKTVTLANNYSNYSIGRGINNYAQLDIKALKVYDRALTASEVLKNFNAIRSRFGL